MKHFKIAIKADHHKFEHIYYTISEAYYAIIDAVFTFNLDADLEEIMYSLVDMDRGELSAHEDKRFLMSIEKE